MTANISKPRIILGIDPGTVKMGYSLILGSGIKPEILVIGTYSLSKHADHYQKLKLVYDKTIHLIKEYHPVELAIESPFFGKNIQSMLKLGRAQGATITAAVNSGLPVFEYAPRKIKMAITGNGNASKEQISSFLSKLLSFEIIPGNLDATDALAAAVCHYFQGGIPADKKSSQNWNDFIKKNPDRIRS
jgi:crossover junction endodeoxyribonuclease RuvC